APSGLVGELQVPSLVAAARATAECDASAREPEVGGVEVAGVEGLLALLDAGDARERRERWQFEPRRGLVLVLDLEMAFGVHGRLHQRAPRGLAAPRGAQRTSAHPF